MVCRVKTPRKINIEPGNDGLEGCFSSSRGVFSGSMLSFQGVVMMMTEIPPKNDGGYDHSLVLYPNPNSQQDCWSLRQ